MKEEQEVDLFFEKNRLKTFKSWPFKSPSNCTKEKMAAAGFHFTGNRREKDLAQCFVCFKELDGWEEDDDPWSEHSRSKDCPFIQLNKTEDQMTLLELYDLIMKRMINKTKMEMEKKSASLRLLIESHEEMLRKG